MSTDRAKPSASLLRVRIRQLGTTLMGVVAVGLIGAVVGLGVGLAQGYRPVVLTSGSMTPTAPTGSLVVAQPTLRIDIGDILVMPDASRATVTHRVVEIETNDDGWLYAVTKGDANEEVDAVPYRLDGEELVGRWIVPGMGSVLLWLGSPLVGLAVIGGAVLLLTMTAVSFIWRSGDENVDGQEGADSDVGEPASHQLLENPKQRLGVMTVLAVLFGATGLAWSMYLGTESVPGNAFSLSDCFDARLGGVQSGQVVSTSNGLSTVTIAAVVPEASFLTYSVRSDASKPGDSVVLGNLADATTIEFLRQTNTTTPPPITIEWSVVEYSCGVSVQRGSGLGDGTPATDFTVSAVDPSTSFVLGGSVASSTEASFDLDDDTIVELVGTDTVRFRHKDALPVDSDRALAYQLVTFADPGDVQTQVVNATIADGAGTLAVTLPQAVPVDSSMVIAQVGSLHGGGDIGERAIRARLTDGSTLELQRQLTTGPVEVQIQVVTFFDGTTVASGVVDLAPSVAAVDVPVAPLDVGRTTVTSTVVVGSGSSGGSTDEAISGEPGEAAVAVSLPSSSTVRVERSATDSSASFAWQAVTWGGPSWADADAPFRQRVDVDAASIDVPNSYTTPLTFDHAALVASGLSQADGNDLRLWSFDGATWTEIDRVLDEDSSWGSPTTTFWFRTQRSIDALTVSSYWLYFGDSTPAPPLDDPTNVWLLDEGFESGLGVFEDRTTGTSWYSADPWTRRIDVSVDATSVAVDLPDLPVLVTVSNADLGSNAQTDGSDIYFTDGSGTRLPHDIESWSSATGTLHAWVRVPSLSSSVDTPLSLYYGAPDAPAQQQPRATWLDQGSVWNFDREIGGPAPELDDLGSSNRDGVAVADAIRVSSPTGYSAQLDGTDDRFETGIARLPDTPLTVSAWFRADTLGGDVVLVASGDGVTTGVFELGIDATTTPGTPTGRFSLRTDTGVVAVSGGLLTAGSWHHLAAVWDSNSVELVLDGVSVASSATSGGLPSDRDAALVLGGSSTGSAALDGQLGQVRVRPEAITVSELAFEWANLEGPTTAVSAGGAITGTFRSQGNWTVRRPITVSSSVTDVDVNDLVVLVDVVDPDLAAAAQGDGDDFVFTAGDGLSRLDHHLESWNPSTGALTAWVRVPLVSSSQDTSLFLYLGNSVAGDQADPIGVWGTDADLVLPSR